MYIDELYCFHDLRFICLMSIRRDNMIFASTTYRYLDARQDYMTYIVLVIIYEHSYKHADSHYSYRCRYETRCDSTETIFFLGTWEKSFEILRTAFANYI